MSPPHGISCHPVADDITQFEASELTVSFILTGDSMAMKNVLRVSSFITVDFVEHPQGLTLKSSEEGLHANK